MNSLKTGLSQHGVSFNTDTDTVKKLFRILVNDS